MAPTDDLSPDALITQRITVDPATGDVQVHRSVGQSTKQLRLAVKFFKQYASLLQRIALAAERTTRRDLSRFQLYDAQIELANAVRAYRAWLDAGHGPTFEDHE